MAERDGDNSFWQSVQKEEVPWCGLCDERTRLMDMSGDETVMARCRRCHPLAGRSLPQHHKCLKCGQVIYPWDQGITCDKHRIVDEWQELCHSGRLVIAIPESHRPRRGEMELRALALQQVAASRLERGPDLDAFFVRNGEARQPRPGVFPGGLPLPESR